MVIICSLPYVTNLSIQQNIVCFLALCLTKIFLTASMAQLVRAPTLDAFVVSLRFGQVITIVIPKTLKIYRWFKISKLLREKSNSSSLFSKTKGGLIEVV